MDYFKVDNGKCVCLLCNYYCHLKPEQVGVCGVNKNIDGKIECLVYGYPSAMNIDPIEKKPLYHFLPQSHSLSLGTVGCNFRCSFCQNWSLSQEKKINKEQYFSPTDIVSLAKENRCRSISFTYNEPTIFYPYAKDIAIQAKKEGIKAVFVSNGFESKEVIEDMVGVIDAANIDLKCFNPKYYKKLGGRLDEVLENLREFKNNNIWLEVTTLIVPTKNDSVEELTKIAIFIKEELGASTPWHISAFHPDYKELDLPRTSVDILKKAYEIGKRVGLNYVYIGNVGFSNHTLCPQCNEKLIERTYFETSINKLENGHCPNCDYQVEGVFK